MAPPSPCQERRTFNVVSDQVGTIFPAYHMDEDFHIGHLYQLIDFPNRFPLRQLWHCHDVNLLANFLPIHITQATWFQTRRWIPDWCWG